MLTTIALVEFNARLTNDADTLLAETGNPNHLTRHAIGTQGDQVMFIFDTVDGPKAGGTELMDVAIFPHSDGAMLVTAQRYTADVRPLINDDTIDAIGKGIYGKYEATGGAKFSALGDPELDGKSGVFFYDRDDDGKYVVKGVGKEMRGYTLDGDKSLVYKDSDLFLVDTTDLLDTLRENAIASLNTVALATATIGGGAKMARVATLEFGGQKTKVWAYVAKNSDGKSTKFYLDYERLVPIATQPFKGTYATTSADGKDMILVGHIVEEGVSEKFEVKRHDLPGFTADAIAA